jgi:outer membrane protein assembly factor BamB
VFVWIAAGWAQSREPAALSLFPVRGAWDLPLHNVLQTTPALAGARAYFPIEGDRLAAYDLEDGTLLWLASAHATSQPAVGDGLVFLVEPEQLTALSEETGVAVWQLPFAEDLSAPLVWDNGWLIGAAQSGTIFAFRATDGTLIWRQSIGADVHAPPALAADRVYVPASDNRVIALDVATGKQLWERRLGGAPNEVLALDDRLYMGSNDNYFYCVSARNGEIMWRWATGGDVAGMPVVNGRQVYFVSFDNILRALDRFSGSQRWKRPLPLRPTRGPVKAGDLLIVSGVAATAPAYLIKDGSPAGSIAGGGELAAAPHVVPNQTLPTLALVVRDLAEGTIVHTITRSIDPAPVPIAPLPNPIPPPPSPQQPQTDSPR